MTAAGKKYFEELEKLAKMEVDVGFQEGEVASDGSTTLAEIAAYNEFGTSTIPPRPFMQQSFESHESEIRNACEEVSSKLADGGSVEEALEPLGVYLKGLVQEEIVDGGFEPNAEATIMKKGSSQPLVDTGHMRQSVNYVIKERTDS